MRKKYDDFTQLKPKDMSKAISDMTYQYINPDTEEPTRVPPTHYEKILGQITEKYMADVTSRQFLVIMYNQLISLKKEDEKYFQQALVCIDMGINPKDLRVDEQIAIEATNNYIDYKKKDMGKDYHFLSDDVIEKFNDSRNDKRFHSDVIKANFEYDDEEYDLCSRIDRDER